jgi:hypothetical protein
MHRLFLSALIFLGLISVLAVAGCIANHTTVQTTPATLPGTSLPVASSTLLYSSTPGPTQTVPEYESVSVTVQRNTITENPTITATFNGGMGNGMVERMDMSVIRSDGITESGHANNPTVGRSITLMGTTGNDRVIVTLAMTSGDQYTVIDRYYPFPDGVLG